MYWHQPLSVDSHCADWQLLEVEWHKIDVIIHKRIGEDGLYTFEWVVVE